MSSFRDTECPKCGRLGRASGGEACVSCLDKHISELESALMRDKSSQGTEEEEK